MRTFASTKAPPTARSLPPLQADRGRGRQHFDRLIENSGTALLAVDDALCVAGISRVAEQLLGHAPRRLHGEPVASLLPVFNKTMPGALERGSPALAVRADGTLMRQRVTAIRLDVQDFHGWIVLLRPDSRSIGH
jgi:nitrogen-specific signal transduction histidine kinase